jgi:hypothetical protein
MKLGLVEGWRGAWRWASIRLGAIASIVLAYLWAAPDMALTVLNSMPPEVRAYLSPVVGIALFALVTATRIVHKPRDPSSGQ